MKLNFDNNSILRLNSIYKKPKMQTINNVDVVSKIEDNIRRKTDIVEISEKGQLKLKLRNLKQANVLEERAEEIKQNINDRIELFESAKGTIQDIIDLVKESMEENVSMEEKESIQSDIEDMIKDIENLVNETAKNNSNSKLEVDISNFNKDSMNTLNNVNEKNSIDIKNNQDNISTEESQEKLSLEEDDNKIDLNKIDILKNPTDALITLGNAFETIMQEIMKLTEQLGELEKNIQKLLGEYDERKELKDLNKMEHTSNDEKEESVEESFF